MTPFVNAVLGLVFLMAGIVATVLMFYLRGHKTGAADKQPDGKIDPQERK